MVTMKKSRLTKRKTGKFLRVVVLKADVDITKDGHPDSRISQDLPTRNASARTSRPISTSYRPTSALAGHH